MDDIIHELLLFVSVVAAPVIFGFLLYLGMHISEHDDARGEDGKANKHQ